MDHVAKKRRDLIVAMRFHHVGQFQVALGGFVLERDGVGEKFG